jgi:membrane protease YdiL (CAAX protease family)
MSPPHSRLAGRDVFLTLAVAIALFGVAFVVLREIGETLSTLSSRRNYWIAYMAAEVAAFLGALYGVLLRRRGYRLSDLGYVAPSPQWAMRGVASGFVALPAAYLILALLRPLLGVPTSSAIQELLGKNFSLLQAGTLLLYAGLLVPVAEELIFRGVVFGWLRDRFAFLPAALMSSAVFGVFHLRPDAVIVTMVMGLAFAWLYERSRSIVPAIIMHSVYNSFTLLLSFALASQT